MMIKTKIKQSLKYDDNNDINDKNNWTHKRYNTKKFNNNNNKNKINESSKNRINNRINKERCNDDRNIQNDNDNKVRIRIMSIIK